MKITWLGHACFKISSGGYSIVIDPYEPNRVPGYGAVTAVADEVFCSHSHGDHNYTDAVTIKDSGCIPIKTETIKSFHDDKNGMLRGENIIHVFSDGETRAAHLGDLGHLLSPEQVKAMGNLDVLMIPVGGFYTIGPEEAVKVIEMLRPRVVMPMHYREGDLGYAEIGLLSSFLEKCDYAQITHWCGNTIEITPLVKKQVAVLSFEKQI